MNRLIENLAQAFVGESQARMRYTEYSKIASKEGYELIGAIFSETADHEKTHAKNYFRMIQRVMKKLGEPADMLELNGVMAPMTHGKSIDNLKAAIAGEHHENSEMYPAIAKIAEEEGFPEVAKQVRGIIKAEEHHEARYKKLLEQLEKGSMFKKDGKIWWLCMECGYWHYAEEPPEVCPSCLHPKAFFKKMDEEF